MFCFKCGAEIPDESEFCMKCGAKMSYSNEDVSSNQSEYIIDPFCYDKEPDKIQATDNELIINCHVFFSISANHIIPYNKIALVAKVYNGTMLNIAYYSDNKYKICCFRCRDKEISNKVFDICSYFSSLNSYSVPQNIIDRTMDNGVTNQSQVISNTATPKEKQLTKRKRIKENKKNGIACCPKCGSTSLSSNKQGFGIGKAVIGASLVSNPIGLVAGNIHSKKIHVTCLNCGHKWTI